MSGLRRVQVTGPAPLAPSVAGDDPQVQRLTAEVTQEAAELLADIALVEQAIAAGTHVDAAAARERLTAAVESADRAAQAATAALEQDFTERGMLRVRSVIDAVRELAPGAAGADLSLDDDVERAQAPASHFRFGRAEAGFDAPALAPFFNRGGWYVAGDAAATLDLVRGTVARAVAQVPPNFLRIVTFDPRIEGSLGMFARLRGANASTFPAAATNSDDFGRMLDAVAATAAANGELVSAGGHADLGGLWRENGSPQGAYTVVVVQSYPAGIDERTQAALVRLAQTGATRGVSLLVQEDPAAAPASGVDPAALRQHLLGLRADGQAWSSPQFPASIPLFADGAPSRTVVEAIVTAAVASSASDTGPSIPLRDFVGDELWTESSAESLDAVIGRAGKEPLVLSLRTENPPHPNMLIGGAVGQGKSNLLLDIVFSLASRYSPDELQLVLLDFKEGLEFQRFGPDEGGANWLPHATVLSLESNKPFGVAVLDHLVDELGRRAAVFKDAKANSINEYRREGGRMPRLLVVIDEFHMLFEGDDDLTQAAVARLEQVAKQGRAFGIHLLLATQSLTGISGLRAKGDSIFAQFPLRVSLKNTADESQALLSSGNKAASELSYRGEVIVNRNFGLDPAGSNERAIAAYADPDFTLDLQQRMWRGATAPEPPLIFLGRSLAVWPAARFAALAPAEELSAWVGMPIEITDVPASVPVSRDVDQAIAVVGRAGEELSATLASVVATLASGLVAGSRIVVLDGEPAESTPWLAPALAHAEGRGVVVERVARADVSAYLLETLAPRISDDETVVVVGIGLHRVADLGDEHAVDPDDVFSDKVSGATVLRTLATRGALTGKFLVGNWTNLRTLNEHLGPRQEGVGVFALFGVGADEYREVLGPYAALPVGSPRVTVFDRRFGDAGRVVVPFAMPGDLGAS